MKVNNINGDIMTTLPAVTGYGRNIDGRSFEETLKAVEKKSLQEDEKLKAACKDFEAMFLNLMWTKMRETVPDNTLYGTSHGEKIIQSMLDTELTKNMADAGGIGIAAMMYRQMSTVK